MSIIDTVNAVQALASTIPGVRTAPAVADYPAALNPSVDCPFVFSWPRAGSWDEPAIGLLSDQESIVISVLVAPVAAGIRGDIVAQAMTLLEAFRLAFQAAENQDLAGAIEQILTTTHAGLQTLTFAGVEFYGFQITIETMLKEIP